MTSPDIPRPLTAAELDAMSPDERAQAFRDRIVTDPDQLPPQLWHRINRTARNLRTRRSDTS